MAAAASASIPAPARCRSAPEPTEAELEKAPPDDPGKFIDFVAGDVDATWKKIFAASGKTYEQPIIVLYDDQVSTACGNAPSTVGPFYCPNDRKVYLDIPFMNELQQRLGAQGDFAQAYIVAHEIGHHVQNLLGVMEDVNLAQQENPEDANDLSVRLELQADCLAGIWAHSAVRQADLLETGDLEEALNAAAAVGDDRIQKQSGGDGQPGHVHPRQRRAAGDVVQERLRVRRPDRLRHLQGRRLDARDQRAGPPEMDRPAHVRRLSRARAGGSG